MMDELADVRSRPITTREEFRRFLTALYRDLQSHPDAWTNTDLVDFLSRMAWYAGDSLDNSYRNTGKGAPPAQGDWEVFADLMMAARIID
jgi:hypothetical protein